MLLVLMIAAVALHERAAPRLYDYAWPWFDCENCVGMPEQPCFCAYHDAVAPCTEPNRQQRFARWLFRKLYRRSEVA